MGKENIGVAPANGLNAAPEKVVKIKKDTSNLYGVLILLIVILIAAAGAFILQQLRSEHEGLGGALNKDEGRIDTLHKQLASLESQMSTLQDQMATHQNLLDTRETKFERELADFKEHHGSQLSAAKAELNDSINNIQALLNKTRGDWMIADAEYLLSVAIHRLNLVGDVKTSLVALQAADERLRDSGNPGVFKVRAQLAREIDGLKRLEPLDVVGVFSRIKVLEEQVATLETFLPHAGVVQEKHKQDKPESTDSVLDSAIENIKGLVTIRRLDKEIIAVLQPEEVRIIREQLKIKLGMIRLALVERDAKLFKQNIDEALAWFKEYFRRDRAETKKFEQELSSLQTVGVDMEVPDISFSLQLLQNLASLRVEHDQSNAAKAVPNPTEPIAPVTRDRIPEGARQ